MSNIYYKPLSKPAVSGTQPCQVVVCGGIAIWEPGDPIMKKLCVCYCCFHSQCQICFCCFALPFLQLKLHLWQANVAINWLNKSLCNALSANPSKTNPPFVLQHCMQRENSVAFAGAADLIRAEGCQ